MIIWSLLFCGSMLAAQSPDEEVYLMDLAVSKDTIQLSSPLNISQNEGYDNQPAFYDDGRVLFASTREGQTDIRVYSIAEGSHKWITGTPDGSEYSPLKIPGKEALSAIRLDRDGMQLLYTIDMRSGKSEVLLPDMKVGYHTWLTENILATSVLAENRMDLMVFDLSKGTHDTIERNVGRSLHSIPGKNRLSYIRKSSGNYELRSLDPSTGSSEIIVDMPVDVEDMCWLANGVALAGQGNRLLYFDPATDSTWQVATTLSDKNIHRITRLSSNKKSTKLAMVAERSPEFIVTQQLEAYNARDIDAFLATYSDAVQLYRFPGLLIAEGKEALRNQYNSLFAATPDLNCVIENRIVFGNKIIDEEYLTINGKNVRAVVIYEVENDQIARVTFIE